MKPLLHEASESQDQPLCECLPSSASADKSPKISTSDTRDISFLNVVVANDYAHVNGGAAQVAVSSALGLAQRGHQVTFFSAVGPVDRELRESQVALVLTDQFDIKSDPQRVRAATQGIWNRQASLRMRELLSRLDPQNTILHVHGWTKALSSSVIQVALSCETHVVVTVHDYFYACPTGGFFNFRTRQACHLRPLSTGCIKERCDRDGYKEKLWRCARQVVQNTLGFPRTPLLSFIILSEFSETVLRPYLPSESAIYHVDNPNDFAKEPPVEVQNNNQFVSIGRLTPEKGPDLLVKAVQGLDCKVTFVGEGPSRKTVVSMMPEAQITGWQSRDCVRRHLRTARALVLSSLWYEVQPLVILESAAMGIPAVVPDQCAAREMVENGVTGLWFRSGDYTDLREKLAILRDPQTAARMGKAAYSRYWENPLTMERHILSLEKCYRTILQAETNMTAMAKSSDAQVASCAS